MTLNLSGVFRSVNVCPLKIITKPFDSFETHYKTMHSPWDGRSQDKFKCMLNHIYKVQAFRKCIVFACRRVIRFANQITNTG